MKVCAKCGKEAIDKEKFCPTCGGRQFNPKVAGLKTKKCERCKKQVDYVWNCANCGKLVCINCAKSHGLIDLLCLECDNLAKEEEKEKQEEPEPKKVEETKEPEAQVSVKKIDFEKINAEKLAITLLLSLILAALFFYVLSRMRAG